MNNEQYLFVKLSEECNEVGILASKIMQFGIDSRDNRERLFAELNDVLASIEMLNEECNLGFEPNIELINQKKEKVKYYRNISKNLGLVD